MAKVKSDGHIRDLEINWFVCILFQGNRANFGWDIANSLVGHGEGHGEGQIRWSHLRPRLQAICLLFVSWQSDHFWLRYSKFHIWPWIVKVKVTTKIDQNLIREYIGQGQQSCQKWKKSKKFFKSYRVNKKLRPVAAPAVAYETVQKYGDGDGDGNGDGDGDGDGNSNSNGNNNNNTNSNSNSKDIIFI